VSRTRSPWSRPSACTAGQAASRRAATSSWAGQPVGMRRRCRSGRGGAISDDLLLLLGLGALRPRRTARGEKWREPVAGGSPGRRVLAATRARRSGQFDGPSTTYWNVRAPRRASPARRRRRRRRLCRFE
jgi:hypothetical protein